MKLTYAIATEANAAEIAALRNSVAEALTELYGKGHWSGQVSERGVAFGIRTSRVVVARRGKRLAGTLRLATKKPWAIDVSYFTPVTRAIYLTDMDVAVDLQRQGIGRLMLDEARQIARDWPGDAIRLDAYDSPSGAGGFYARCGYRETARVAYRGTPLVYYELIL